MKVALTIVAICSVTALAVTQIGQADSTQTKRVDNVFVSNNGACDVYYDDGTMQSCREPGKPPAPRTFRGKTAKYWFVAWKKRIQVQRQISRSNKTLRAQLTLAHKRNRGLRSMANIPYGSAYAIALAATAYRQSYTDMIRVANCESPGLDPTLVNDQPIYNGEHATGLFQFIPSTWASTPYAGYNIFDPYANSLAAGWMWSVGRRGEWACK